MCARGRAARRCSSIAVSYVRFTPAIRFYWEVLRSAHACLFSFVRKRETACDMFRSCSAVGRDRHSCVLGCRVVIGLCWFTSGLRVSLWRSRRRTKGRGERSRRRGVSALLREHIGFEVFSAGSPLGAARPQTCAKESLALWTLFIWVVMWVRFTQEGA